MIRAPITMEATKLLAQMAPQTNGPVFFLRAELEVDAEFFLPVRPPATETGFGLFGFSILDQQIDVLQHHDSSCFLLLAEKASRPGKTRS